MIEVQSLSKSVEDNVIFTDLTFHLESGDCLALLGTNGSGKTLLLRIMATLEKPTGGTVTIAGHNAFANLRTVRPVIGYVPEIFDVYPHLSITEYLDFFAGAYKLEKRGRTTAIQDVLNLMDIASLSNRKIQFLSQGEKRRLCFAKTFLHDPQVWLLDEPLSGLDVRGQIEMSALIQELTTIGKTIVIATNRPADATPICNHVAILAQGGLAFYDGSAEIEMNLEDLFLEVTTPQTTDEGSEEPDPSVGALSLEQGKGSTK